MIAAAAAAAAVVVPSTVERRLNSVAPKPIAVGPRATVLHARLLVADLHADTLLWDRDLLRRGSRGHVDVPRLIEGGVAIQAFTVVTKSPKNLNIERNDDRSDDITLLAVAQRWPPATWTSLRARALHQAARLDAAARRSKGALTFVRTAAELDAFLERRRADPRLVAGILGLEGSHALEGDLRNVDVLSGRGLPHDGAHALLRYRDRRVRARRREGRPDRQGPRVGARAGGPQGARRPGARVAAVDRRRAALARRPVVVSHTGVRGTCDNRRNLSDAQLRAIAATGGVVGIGFWDTAVCGDDARAIARAIVLRAYAWPAPDARRPRLRLRRRRHHAVRRDRPAPGHAGPARRRDAGGRHRARDGRQRDPPAAPVAAVNAPRPRPLRWNDGGDRAHLVLVVDLGGPLCVLRSPASPPGERDSSLDYSRWCVSLSIAGSAPRPRRPAFGVFTGPRTAGAFPLRDATRGRAMIVSRPLPRGLDDGSAASAWVRLGPFKAIRRCASEAVAVRHGSQSGAPCQPRTRVERPGMKHVEQAQKRSCGTSSSWLQVSRRRAASTAVSLHVAIIEYSRVMRPAASVSHCRTTRGAQPAVRR